MATIVRANPSDSNDQVIKKFKKKVLQENILEKIRENEFYKKPSEKRKEIRDEYRKRKKRRQQAARRAK